MPKTITIRHAGDSLMLSRPKPPLQPPAPAPQPSARARIPTVREAEAAEVAATAAYRAAAADRGAGRAADEAWAFYGAQRPDDVEGRLARAQAAERTMNAFARLRPAHYAALCELQHVRVQGGYTDAIGERAEAAYRSVPLLAEYREAFHKAAAERAEVAATAERAARETAEREAPRAIVERLRAAGVALSVSGDGQITAPAGAAIPATERQLVVRYRDGIVALLKAEAEAAAKAAEPVVLA